MNIAMLLQMAADTCPDRVALTSHHQHYTYGQIFGAAARAADLIRESGCPFVSVLDTSSPAVPIALLGAAMSGVPYVPLNYRLTHAQLDALVERISPPFLIADDHHRGNYESIPGATVLSQP